MNEQTDENGNSADNSAADNSAAGGGAGSTEQSQVTAKAKGAGSPLSNQVAGKDAGKAAGKAASQKPTKGRRGFRIVALLTLLLFLAAAGVSGWGWLYLQEVEWVRAEAEARTQRQFTAQLDSARRDMEQRIERAAATLRNSRREELAPLRQALETQRRQLLELGGADRSDWSLAEALYLVRLAHQRLLLAGDTGAALQLLTDADAIIGALADPALHPVRAALAEDMAALRAIPQLDLEGAWLRLRALAGEVDSLPMFGLPQHDLSQHNLPQHKGETEPSSGPATGDADADPPRSRGIRAAMDRFASYFVIRHRETPYQPLLSPQWAEIVQQNLRLLLEQAQVALLSREPTIYAESIAAARRWTAEFFALDEAAVAALDAELAALAALDIERRNPSVNASLDALESAINSRRAGGD